MANLFDFDILNIYHSVNPIPTSHGRNQPIYEHHVTKSGRNRVNPILHSHGNSKSWNFADVIKKYLHLHGFRYLSKFWRTCVRSYVGDTEET